MGKFVPGMYTYESVNKPDFYITREAATGRLKLVEYLASTGAVEDAPVWHKAGEDLNDRFFTAGEPSPAKSSFYGAGTS